tara:strand:+ start:105 stop:236 length:132 start_codon:yes stop_codon:yes gene_type:complete
LKLSLKISRLHETPALLSGADQYIQVFELKIFNKFIINRVNEK